MKKKLALTVAAVALVGTLAVGGTLAWFTDVETATNVVTTGKVDITLSEHGGEDGTTTEDGLKYDDVMPGDKFQKTVTIENVGNDAYVRANIIVSGEDVILNALKDEQTEIKFVTKSADSNATTPLELVWSDVADGACTATVYYPLNDGVMVKEDKWTLFDGIEIPGEGWDNLFVDETFNIKIVAEAIQSSNMASEDAAWGNSVVDISGEKVDAVGNIEGVKAPTKVPEDQN